MKWPHILVVLAVAGLCIVSLAILLSPSVPGIGSISQQAENPDDIYSEIQPVAGNENESGEKEEYGLPGTGKERSGKNNPRNSSSDKGSSADKEGRHSSSGSRRGKQGGSSASNSRRSGRGGGKSSGEIGEQGSREKSSLTRANKLKPGIRIISRKEFQDYIDSIETPSRENGGGGEDEGDDPDDRTKGFIAGYVVDESGAPINGADVKLSLEEASFFPDAGKGEDLSGFPKTGRTDANGRFFFSDLPLLSFSIMIECEGFLPEYFAAIRLQEEGEAYLEVVLRNSLVVGGVVMDGDGNPVQGAKVTSTYHIEVGPGFTSETISDPNGNFFLPVREGSSNEIEATKLGYLPAKLSAISQGKMDLVLVLTRIPTGLVTGRVVDSSTGNPLGEITIDGENIITANGFFEIERAVSSRPQKITVDAPGWQSKNVRFILKESGTVDLGEISLLMELRLRGLVVVAQTEPPQAIAGASVLFQPSTPDAQTGITNTEGSFLFEGVAPGTVTLEVSASGYFPQTKKITIENYDPEKPETKEAFVLINLEAGGLVASGTVTNAQTGEAVSEVSLTIVELPSLTTLSAEDGSYLIDDISLESFKVRASKPGYVTATSDTLSAGSEGTSIICDFKLEPGGFHGVLLCSGKPVPEGVTVNLWKKTDGPIAARLLADSRLNENRFIATTDNEGKFTFLDIADGSYFLHVPEYQQWPLEVNVDSSSSEIMNLELPGVAEVRGNISYADGSPVANTSLYLHSGDNDYSIAASHTDENGNYVIKRAAKLNYALSIIKSIADQSAQHVVEFALQSVPVQVMDVKFPPLSATITGKLTNEQGKPKPGVQVGVEYLDSPHRAILAGWVLTDANGNYTLPRLEPGRHVVRTAWTDDEVVFSDIIELKENESKEVNLVAPGITGKTISGHLITSDGAPLAGSFIFAINADGKQSGNFFANFTWGYARSFKIRGLKPGSYTLVFTSTGCKKKSVNVEVAADMTNFVVTMDRE